MMTCLNKTQPQRCREAQPRRLNRHTLSSMQLNQAGFSLIELMVVIVIVGVLASMVVVSLDGMEQRKAMQVRDVLVMDLKKINREANDQARIYALQTQAATDVSPFRYVVVGYQPRDTQSTNRSTLLAAPTWQPASQFSPRELPPQVSLHVEPSQDARPQSYLATAPSALVGERAPKMVWFGNGETQAVTIQVYYAQTPIGAPVVVDYLGRIDAQ